MVQIRKEITQQKQPKNSRQGDQQVLARLVGRMHFEEDGFGAGSGHTTQQGLFLSAIGQINLGDVEVMLKKSTRKQDENENESKNHQVHREQTEDYINKKLYRFQKFNSHKKNTPERSWILNCQFLTKKRYKQSRWWGSALVSQ